MNAVVTLPTAPLGLAHPPSAATPPLDAILSASGPAFMGVFAPGGDFPEPPALRDRVARAEAFLDRCVAHAAALREAAEPVPVDEIGPQLGLFVTAWPNASHADLAGYGAQLAEDVIERRPCRYPFTRRGEKGSPGRRSEPTQPRAPCRAPQNSP